MGISRIPSEAPFGADLDRFGVIFMDFRSRHNRWELMSLIHEEFKEMDIISNYFKTRETIRTKITFLELRFLR